MAHQSSVMRASVTRFEPETYETPEPENKTEEKKEDAQLEIPLTKQPGSTSESDSPAIGICPVRRIPHAV